MTFCRSITGFSLTSVMIGIGMTSILALMTLSTTQIGLQGQKTVGVQGEINQFDTEMQRLLQNPTYCSAALNGNPANGAGSIRRPNGQILVQSGNQYGSLTTESVSFTQVATLASGVSDVQLTVAFRKPALSLGSSTSQKRYRVIASVNASEQITGCSLSGGSAASIFEPRVIYVSTDPSQNGYFTMNYGVTVPVDNTVQAWRRVFVPDALGKNYVRIRVVCSESLAVVRDGSEAQPAALPNDNNGNGWNAFFTANLEKIACFSGNNQSNIGEITVGLDAASTFWLWIRRVDWPSFATVVMATAVQ